METGVARRGLMLVLSSPSGAGKTTLARRLRDEDPGIEMSISHTTRPRSGTARRSGRDYHFVDRDTFTRMRDQGEFLEWAVVFDNYYGTTRKPVEAALAAGRDVLFDVDWQGAASLREKAEGRRRHRLYSAAHVRRTSSSGSMSGRRTRRRSCGGACSAPATRSSIGTNMIMS